MNRQTVRETLNRNELRLRQTLDRQEEVTKAHRGVVNKPPELATYAGAYAATIQAIEALDGVEELEGNAAAKA